MKKKYVMIGIISLVSISLVVALLVLKKEETWIFKPAITVVSPQPLKAEPDERVTVDVTLSDMPKETYPGASINVSFDPKKLEFVGIKQGNITIPSRNKDGEEIPIWECDVKKSNEKGEVKAMFIDMSGGKYSYSQKGFKAKDQDILLRMQFKLTDNVKKGETYELIIEDGVLATMDNQKNKTSLSIQNHKLDAHNGKIKMK